jgi:ParB/RepB/Spo0J family partition protein
MKEAKIELSKIRFTSNRTHGGEGDLKILAEDIKRNGLINPITVKYKIPNSVGQTEPNTGIYEVIAGRRRVLAVTQLGWKDIQCRILEGDENERADEIAGSENINRLSMHPLDEATVFHQLLENGRSIEELAKQYDRKKSEIWQRIQLLDLSDDIKIMFRNGLLSLQSAAMIKSLDAKAQKSFYQKYGKQKSEIEDDQVKNFISHLGHDRLYGFLCDKQCAECKTRTFYSDKNLFPEMDDAEECCFNHECYLNRWQKILANRIFSIMGEHKKTHGNAVLICTEDYHEKLIKIFGKKVTLEKINFTVRKMEYFQKTSANDKEAEPCFIAEITHSGKLEVKPAYFRKKASSGNRYSSLSGEYKPEPAKKKQLTPIVKLLDLPAEEEAKALDAMTESRRITSSGLVQNVREKAFDKIIEVKVQEFNTPKITEAGSKIAFLKKYFESIKYNNSKKGLFNSFAGKMSFEELAKMPEEKIFSMLCAFEYSAWQLPDPDKFDKEKTNGVMEWIGASKGKLKEIYQEEIRKRIPKQKPEPKKPVEKKQTKSAVKITPTMPEGIIKKPIVANGVIKKPHTGFVQDKGKKK